jgi:nicotinate-nucleotide pyrophosphorylase (carboxylating)
MKPTDPWLRELIRRALEEDLGGGDLTSEACVPVEQEAHAVMVGREDGVLAGAAAAQAVFLEVNSALDLCFAIREGESFSAGQELAQVSGPTRDLLAGERVALNFLQRLCGIATLARAYVDQVAGTSARIVDTRKTTPGLRRLEKEAVRAGGGHNHRFNLGDGVLLKDNHLAATESLTAAVQAARARAHQLLRVEVEITSLEQLEEALTAGADIVMLDNMSLEEMAQAVSETGGRALLEASGNVNLETVGDIARTGVDFISVGRLTHSVRSLDLSMELTVR